MKRIFVKHAGNSKNRHSSEIRSSHERSETFHAETRAWFQANCPPEMREPERDESDGCWGGRDPAFKNAPQKQWMEVMIDLGDVVVHAMQPATPISTSSRSFGRMRSAWWQGPNKGEPNKLVGIHLRRLYNATRLRFDEVPMSAV